MLQTTQIELEQKDCILLVNYLGIQFTHQLCSTMSLPTRLGRIARPMVTSANLHYNKYEVNNPQLGSLLVNGYLKSSITCFVNVANHTDRTQTKGLYIPRKII